MIYEDNVNNAVGKYLEKHGYDIEKIAKTTEKGPDIIAVKKRKYLLIEGKGEGSSSKTARAGKSFTRNQVVSCVSKAVFKALSLKDAKPCDVGVAFPDTLLYREIFGKAQKSIKKLSVKVFWVDRKGNVQLG